MSIPTVLVIEDNVADLYLIRHALDDLGAPYRLETLPDGEAALTFIQEHRSGVRQHEPCIILLDLHLPKYNGIEVLTALKQEPVLSHIHVVVLTSFASPSEQERVIELGGQCVMKPSDLTEYGSLAAAVMNLCRDPNQPLVSSAAL